MSIKYNIIKLYLTGFLTGIHFFGPVTVAFYMDRNSLSYSDIFIIEIFFALGVFFFEIPTGLIADKLGRKHSLYLGSLLTSLGVSLFYIFDSIAGFIFANIFLAMALTMKSGADKALLYDTLLELKEEDNARFILSKYEAFGTAGIITGFISGTYFVDSGLFSRNESLGITFLMTSIIFLLAFFIYLTLKEPDKKTETRKKSLMREGLDGFTYIFTNRKLRELALNYVFIAAATHMIFWFYQSVISRAGLSVIWNGWTASGFNLLGIILLSNIRMLEKIIGIKKLLFLTGMLPGIFFIILGITKNIYICIFAVHIIASMKLLRKPVLFDFMNREIESRNRATVLSGISMFNYLSISMFYPATGFIADISLNHAFLFLGIIIIFFSIFFRIKNVS